MCPYGDQWRLTRKFYSCHMLNTQYAQQVHFPRVLDEAHRLVFGDIYTASCAGAEIDLSMLFHSLQWNIMSRAVLGKQTVEASTMSAPKFYAILREVDRLLGPAHIGALVPALSFIDRKKRLALDRCHRTIDAGLEKALSQREMIMKRLHNTATHQCLLDILLAASDPPLDRERIKAMMLEVISAGTHTTSLALDWSMAELLSNESVMKKAVAEVDRAVGKERMVTVEDVQENKMPYIRAIVKETLRLHPIAPLLLPHMAMAPCELTMEDQNYRIPADMLVLVNAWAIGRDEATWGPDATAFVPERFLDSSIDLRGHHFELLPFGAGRRICPGLAIAIPTLELILATMLHCCRWKTSCNTPTDLTEALGGTLPRDSRLLVVPTNFRLDPKLALRRCRPT